MTIPTSIKAYEDCLKVFQAALDSSAGIRLRYDDHGTATYFRMRLHQARALERKENARTYEPGHPMHGRSLFDPYAVRVLRQEDCSYVYVEPVEKHLPEIEELTDEMELLPMPAPRLMLSAPRPELVLEATKSEVLEPIRRRF